MQRDKQEQVKPPRQVCVQLSGSTRAEVERWAKDNGLNVSDVLRMALARFLKAEREVRR